MLTDRRVDEFVEQLASSAPVPGGGAVAALAGALAAALVEMTCNLTIGKRKYRAVEAEVRQIRDQAQVLRKELLRMVEDDARAYQAVADAYRMPVDGDDERRRRNEVLQAALVAAANSPAVTGRLCRSLLPLARDAARLGNTAVVSDAGVAAELALAGLRSAVLNVQINLRSIQDQSFVQQAHAEMTAIETGAAQLAAETAEEVRRKMGLTDDD